VQLEKNFAIIPIFGIFQKISIQMNKNTSISLGSYFDQFVQSRISEGRFKNVQTKLSRIYQKFGITHLRLGLKSKLINIMMDWFPTVQKLPKILN